MPPYPPSIPRPLRAIVPAQTHPQTAWLWPLILAWGQGEEPTASQYDRLVAWELSQPQRSLWQAVSGSPEPIVARLLQERAKTLQILFQEANPNQAQAAGGVDAEVPGVPLPGRWQDWIDLLWCFWLPLAQSLDHRQKTLGAPLIQGILGGQGTGKSTLTRILQILLALMGQRTAGFSLDDLYLTYDERCALMQQDPRLRWRGPPGTHDIQLGLDTLQAIKQASQPSGAGAIIPLPRFDKSLHQGQGDRVDSILIPAPTITIFEGWFVGAKPVSEKVFREKNPLPAPIDTASDRAFAQRCNQALKSYLSLWDLLDSLIVLYPEDYRLCQQWRQQAEQNMIREKKTGLPPKDIRAFVEYFWKALHPDLFVTPLTQCPSTDWVVCLQRDHHPGSIYSPADRGE